mmetsp:Transcript_13529/g.30005  ORF Transcript_13529/g.30005 Transcript_13529/m.30005 type:complete len:452 (+) Transcript_13529:110-1465(+)
MCPGLFGGAVHTPGGQCTDLWRRRSDQCRHHPPRLRGTGWSSRRHSVAPQPAPILVHASSALELGLRQEAGDPGHVDGPQVDFVVVGAGAGGSDEELRIAEACLEGPAAAEMDVPEPQNTLAGQAPRVPRHTPPMNTLLPHSRRVIVVAGCPVRRRLPGIAPSAKRRQRGVGHGGGQLGHPQIHVLAHLLVLAHLQQSGRRGAAGPGGPGGPTLARAEQGAELAAGGAARKVHQAVAVAVPEAEGASGNQAEISPGAAVTSVDLPASRGRAENGEGGLPQAHPVRLTITIAVLRLQHIPDPPAKIPTGAARGRRNTKRQGSCGRCGGGAIVSAVGPLEEHVVIIALHQSPRLQGRNTLIRIQEAPGPARVHVNTKARILQGTQSQARRLVHAQGVGLFGVIPSSKTRTPAVRPGAPIAASRIALVGSKDIPREHVQVGPVAKPARALPVFL